MSAGRVVLHNGVALREPPPRKDGRADCTCMFCCHFRAKHLWTRAIGTSMLLPPMLLFAWAVTRADFHQPNGGGAVGGVLIVLTATVFIVGVAWYQPIKRTLHLRRPRTTGWPPTWS